MARNTDPTAVLVSGKKLKKLLRERGYSYASFSKISNIPEHILELIARYYCKTLRKEFDFFCYYFNVTEDYLLADDIEKEYIYNGMEKIRCKASSEGAYKRLFEITKKRVEDFLRTNYIDKKIILNGFLFLFAKYSFDLCELEDESKIKKEKLIDLLAFNESTVEEAVSIYMFLYRQGFVKGVYDLLLCNLEEKEAPKEDQGWLAEYAAELYCETHHPDKLKPIYFWKRACLSEEVERNYKMPDWFDTFAKYERFLFQTKQKEKKENRVL